MADETLDRARVKAPPGYKDEVLSHRKALLKMVETTYGPGWHIESVEKKTDGTFVNISRVRSTTEVSAVGASTLIARLSAGTKPSEGEAVAARLEERNPGYRLTDFDFALGRATLKKMDDKTYSARRSIAAALSVKPWEVQVSKRKGGFDIVLPTSYTSAKHYDKLLEVVEGDIGQVGWEVKVDPKTLKGTILKADPPSFPPMYPLPFESGQDADNVLFGIQPVRPGRSIEPLFVNWNSAHGCMVAGLPGGGKSVVINALIAGHLLGGGELVIIDDKNKAVDFDWCKPFVRDHGWGADSLWQSVVALALVREEGQKRADYLKEQGVKNWLDLPKDKRFAPLLVVVDEGEAMLSAGKKPVGLDRDHPLLVEWQDEAASKAYVGSHINHIIQELRFVGIRMILSSQVTNAATGIAPSLKNKFGHRMLLGASPSPNALSQAFSDPSAIPEMPENIVRDDKASKGAGFCYLEGQGAYLFKGAFASTGDISALLEKMGVRKTLCPTPTKAQMMKYGDGQAVDLPDKEEIKKASRTQGFDQGLPDDFDGDLKGAARASHQLALEAAMKNF